MRSRGFTLIELVLVIYFAVEVLSSLVQFLHL